MSTSSETESEFTDGDGDGDGDSDPRELLYNSWHRHGLVFQELTGNFGQVVCYVCRLMVKGGSAYYCPKPNCRKFFMHKYCAELPCEIQNLPFHPQHQLHLRAERYKEKEGPCSGCSCLIPLDEYSYRCLQCPIALHVGCVDASLPDGEHDEEETIQHIAHEHPLESFCVNNSPFPPYCSACNEKISGCRAYGCRACIFVLHESCALSPQEIKNHPLHPQHPLTLVVDFKDKVCRACRNDSTRFAYRCNECDFYLDMRCAVYVERHYISIPEDDHRENDRQEIQHFFHPHPMVYCYTKEAIGGLECDFCEKKITGDLYVCGDCSFKLHKSCAEFPREMVHPLHPHHHLIFQTEYSDCPGDCAFCGYRCKILLKCQECDFGLHLVCAIKSLSASEVEITGIINPIHEHPLRLWINSFSCNVCHEAADDLAYGCEKFCNFFIHRSCAEAARESQHSVHPQHPLILLSQPPDKSRACCACLYMCSGFTYHCDYCKFNCHPHCIKMKPSLKHERHEHSLTYFSQINHGVQCNVCYADCRVDLYRCTPCNYNLHYGCLPLPPCVQHEWHIHTMELRGKYINDTFDDQYCDMCETLRHPERGVYVCEECRCATHIDCAIPRVDLEKRKRVEDRKMKKLDERIFELEIEKEAVRINLERLEKNLEELKAEKLKLAMAV